MIYLSMILETICGGQIFYIMFSLSYKEKRNFFCTHKSLTVKDFVHHTYIIKFYSLWIHFMIEKIHF